MMMLLQGQAWNQQQDWHQTPYKLPVGAGNVDVVLAAAGFAPNKLDV
jgi:hypothetical protein